MLYGALPAFFRDEAELRILKLKYNNAIADAITELGRPEEIGRVFAGFQQYLYQPQAVA